MEAKIDLKSDRVVGGFLDAILIPTWSPEWLPKLPKTNTKSIQNRIFLEKHAFLKNSTTLTRNTMFGTQGPPNTLPKLSKKDPGTDEKSD